MAKETTAGTKPKQLEIAIYSVIGQSFWDDATVSAVDVKKLLEGGEYDEVLVRINSPGGNAYDGIAIYNLLARLEQKVIVEIDGLAASAASIVAMAGDEIRMAANALMMIHDAWTIVLGNSQELQKYSSYLAKLDQGLAKTYAARTKGDEAVIAKQMDDETWFTADEAKAAGFCDAIISAKEASASFDLSAFKCVPAEAAARFGKQDGRHFAIAAGPLPLEKLFPSFSFEEQIVMSKPTEQHAAGKPVETKTEQTLPAITAADVDKAKTDGAAAAKAAEKERTSKILALCNEAGKPEQAPAFIDGDLSVVDVQAKLFNSMCADRTPVGDAGGQTNVASQPDANADAKKEYKANPHLAAVMSEGDYLAQKKRDEAGGYVTPKNVAEKLAAL